LSKTWYASIDSADFFPSLLFCKFILHVGYQASATLFHFGASLWGTFSLHEQVKACLADKDDRALKYQKLLVEVNEAAQRRYFSDVCHKVLRSYLMIALACYTL